MKTKYSAPLTFLLGALFLVGCNNSSQLNVATHGAPIAQSIGKSLSELTFISNGDFALMSELEEGFNPATKGLVALTETSLFWRNGQGEISDANTFKQIPLELITGAADDDGVLQLMIGEEIHVLRLTDWNRFQKVPAKAHELLKILHARNIPELTIKNAYEGRPADRVGPYADERDRLVHEFIVVTDANGHSSVQGVWREWK